MLKSLHSFTARLDVNVTGKDLVELDALHVKQFQDKNEVKLAILDKDTRIVAQCLFNLDEDLDTISRQLQQCEIINDGNLLEVHMYIYSSVPNKRVGPNKHVGTK